MFSGSENISITETSLTGGEGLD